MNDDNRRPTRGVDEASIGLEAQPVDERVAEALAPSKSDNTHGSRRRSSRRIYGLTWAARA
jgi:hypothetical protein